MSSPVLDWVVAHKEWCFTVLCTTLGGALGFLKWKWPTRNREALKPARQDSIALEGSGNAVVAVATGATLTGGVIAGSHNVQNVVINQNLHSPAIPIRERKSSTPTGNEIRQREDEVLKEIPLYLQNDVLQKYLKGFMTLPVAWPIRIYGVYAQERREFLRVNARFGDETWGAFIRFDVRESDFPILKTLVKGHRAFVEGRISGIDEHIIDVEVSKLEFE